MPQFGRINRLFFNIPQLHNQYNYVPLSRLSSSCSVPKSSSSFTIQKLNMGHQFLLLCCFQLPQPEEIFKEVVAQVTLTPINNSSSVVRKANYTVFKTQTKVELRSTVGGCQKTS